MKEVELITDSSAVQLSQNNWYDDDFERTSTWTGEPIATVQKRIAAAAMLQTEDRDLVARESWYDRSLDEEEENQSRVVQVNKFDGLVHHSNGKMYTKEGKEVV